MTMWTSRRAILRDLSLAQGGRPPAAPGAHTLRPADRPPRQASPEDIQLTEEYQRACSGESEWDPATSPDLGLIQHMLNMVRELNIAPEDNPDDVALVSKLNPYSKEFTPFTLTSNPQMNKAQKKPLAEAGLVDSAAQLPLPRKRKRILRNVALESILQTIELNKRNGDSGLDKGTLLKPNDFENNSLEIVNNKVCSSFIKNMEHSENNLQQSCKHLNVKEKVNSWMDHMTDPIQSKSQSKQAVKNAIRLDPTSMFKKKADSGSTPPLSPAPKPQERTRHGKTEDVAYVPSARASQYYDRYLENSRAKEALREDMWARAERKMKQIDDSRCREQAAGAGDGPWLAAPRRSLPAPCAVCRAARPRSASDPLHTELCAASCSVETSCPASCSVETSCPASCSVETPCVASCSVETPCVASCAVETPCVASFSVETPCVASCAVETSCAASCSVKTPCAASCWVETPCPTSCSVETPCPTSCSVETPCAASTPCQGSVLANAPAPPSRPGLRVLTPLTWEALLSDSDDGLL